MKKRKSTLILSVVMSAITAFSATACGQKGPQKPNPDEVTYVKVLHYDSGYGRTHIEKTKALFEDLMKDVEYEPGKKGVYIDISHLTTGVTGQTLLNGLGGSNYYDIYLTSGVTPADMKANDNIRDITSLMTASSLDANNTYDFADEQSIYDRMYPDMQSYYAFTEGTQTKLYGAPVYMMTSHLYYAKDLVEKRGLYIAQGSTDTNIILKKTAQQQKQLGVDGLPNTEDDGLPETWEQFYNWLVEVEKVNITPIHYSGLYQQHMDWALGQFWADTEGATNVKACYAFDGTVMANLIDTLSEDGSSITYHAPTAITTENGYMVQRQESRYRVIQLAKRLADTVSTSDPLIHASAFASSETHTEAQGTFVTDYFSSQPILLFAESSYWEAEATDKFAALEGRKGGKLDRQIAVLPTPKYSRAEVGTSSRSTIIASDAMTSFLHSRTVGASNQKAVDDFFMFFNKAENMDMQFNESASLRPYTFTIDDTVKANMSYMQKDYHRLMNDSRTDVVFINDNNNFYRANQGQLDKDKWTFYSQYLGDEKSYVSIGIFKDNNGKNGAPLVTAEDYFEGLYKVYTQKTGNAPTLWEQMLAKVK